MSWLLVPATAVLIGASPVAAEVTGDVTGDVTGAGRAALVAQALERHPDVRAAEAAVESVTERPARAGSLPDPTFTIGYQNDGVSPSLGVEPMTQLAFVWSQAIPFPGKLGLASQVRERDVDLARARLERVRRGVQSQVEQGWASLALARRKKVLLDLEAGSLRELEGVARARYAAGLATQQDVIQAQVVLMRLEESRLESAVEERLAAAELNRLRDFPKDAPLDVGAELTLDETPPDRARVLDSLDLESPELRAAGSVLEQAGLEHDLAEKGFYPDLFVAGGYMNRGGLDPMWQASVGFSLPLWAETKQKPALREAAALARGATASADSIRLLLRSRTEQRLDAIDGLIQALVLERDQVLPQEELAVDSALAGYRSAQLSFAAVLDPLITLYRDRAIHAARIADLWGLRAQLAELSLAPVTITPRSMTGAAAASAAMAAPAASPASDGAGSASSTSSDPAPASSGGMGM